MTNIKRIFTAAFALALLTSAAISQAEKAENTASGIPVGAKPLLVDNFEYPVGQLVTTSTGAWLAHSGAGSVPVTLTAGSLSYANYPSSGVGNKLDIVSPAGSAEDVNRHFKIQGVGSTTYVAFMVNVANLTGLPLNTSTTGEYFAGLSPTESTTTLNGRVAIRLGAVSGFQLGLRASTTNAMAEFNTTDLAVGTTHLVVLSYQVVAGNTNDIVRMWVNPTITTTEPGGFITQTTASVTDITNVARFFVRQSTGATPNASIDGLRVGKTWYDAVITGAVPTAMDYNADGKADFAISRFNVDRNETWVLFNGSPSYLYGWITGPNTDIPVAADFDGDAKVDLAVWRPAPATQAAFYIFQSTTNTIRTELFGQNGDDPRVVADYDGDGKADPAVFRGSGVGQQSTWFFRGSLGNPGGNVTYLPWGVGGDVPTSGDFDGDAKADLCVRRGGAGQPAVFYLYRSMTASVEYVFWGLGDDSIHPGDYDGDGRNDFAVARPSGANFNLYILERDGGGTGAAPFVFASTALQDNGGFGDYDGDGRTDIGIWREDADPTQNFFWIRRSLDGNVFTQEWGHTGDSPLAEWNTTGGE